MNKFWPKEWKDKMPNFLGEDFLNGFDTNGNNDMSNAPNNSGIKVNVCESDNELLCI